MVRTDWPARLAQSSRSRSIGTVRRAASRHATTARAFRRAKKRCLSAVRVLGSPSDFRSLGDPFLHAQNLASRPGILADGGRLLLDLGLRFPIAKLAIATCPPEFFLAIRFIAAGEIMLGWAFWRGYLATPLPWLGLIGLGLLNFGLSNGLGWAGLKTVSAGLATIIQSAQPVLVGVVGALLLGDPLKPRRILGLVLGVAGVAFVVRNRIVLSGEDALGVMMIVVSVFTFATGTILFKRWSPQMPLTVLVGVQQLAAGLGLLVVALTIDPLSQFVPDGAFWMALAYTGILNSIVSFQLWFFMLANSSATSVASLQFVMPPLGLFFSWLILGELIQILDLVGLVPVLVGIGLTTRSASPRRAAA